MGGFQKLGSIYKKSENFKNEVQDLERKFKTHIKQSCNKQKNKHAIKQRKQIKQIKPIKPSPHLSNTLSSM